MGEQNAERQILNLLHRYAELVDAGEFDAVGELFTGATYRMGDAGPVLEGARVAEMMRSLVATDDRGSPGTKHVVTNTILEPGGDGVMLVRSYFTVLQSTDALPLQPIITGRYTDRFVEEGGRWRFADRRIDIEQVGDLSAHLRADLRPGAGTDQERP